MSVTDPKPVLLVVGNVPTSPVIVVGPVLVMPAPARTANGPAVPRPTGPLVAAVAAPARNADEPSRVRARRTGAAALRPNGGTVLENDMTLLLAG